MLNTKENPNKRSMSTRMGIAAVILSVSILLSRVLGFLREAVIAYFHGASAATDAYYAAFTLPDLMAYFLAGGTLSITFIPLFSSFVSNGDEEGGWNLFSTVASTMGVALLAFTLLFEYLAPTVVPWVFPGFKDATQLALAVEMTRIVLPAQLAFYFGGLISATLFVRETFWPSALAPLVYNTCIIVGGVALAPWLGIRGFAFGVLVGAFLGPLGLPLWAARKQIRFKFRFAPHDTGFRTFFLLTLPLMLGVSLVTVDEWFLKYLGSMHAEGSITWLNNGRKLMLMAFAIIGQAAGQAALPFLTRLFHQDKLQEMGDMLASSLQRVLFLAVVAAFGLVAVAEPAVFVIFRRGAFSAADAAATARILAIFAIGLPAWAAQSMIARGFYARQDTLTPMLIGTAVVICTAPLYFALDKAFGLQGLPAATSIGITLNALTSLFVYRVRYRYLDISKPLGALARGLVFGAVCGIPAYFAGQYLFDPASMWTTALAFASVFAVFGAIASPLAWVWHIEELEFAVRRIKSRFKRAGQK